jgi:hypothetical protein
MNPLAAPTNTFDPIDGASPAKQALVRPLQL